MKNKILKFVLSAYLVSLLTSCIGLTFERPKDTTCYHTIPLAKVDGKVAGLNDVAVNVFEVRIPSYMARNQIVKLASQNSSELLMSDNNIWAEPVQNAFTRAITYNLAEITGSKNISSNLVSSDVKTIALKVNILECISTVEGALSFKAQYSIILADKTISNIFAFETNVGASYNDYVNGISKALNALSLDICKKISEFKK